MSRSRLPSPNNYTGGRWRPNQSFPKSSGWSESPRCLTPLIARDLAAANRWHDEKQANNPWFRPLAAVWRLLPSRVSSYPTREIGELDLRINSLCRAGNGDRRRDGTPQGHKGQGKHAARLMSDGRKPSPSRRCRPFRWKVGVKLRRGRNAGGAVQVRKPGWNSSSCFRPWSASILVDCMNNGDLG